MKKKKKNIKEFQQTKEMKEKWENKLKIFIYKLRSKSFLCKCCIKSSKSVEYYVQQLILI